MGEIPKIQDLGPVKKNNKKLSPCDNFLNYASILQEMSKIQKYLLSISQVWHTIVDNKHKKKIKLPWFRFNLSDIVQ